MGHGNLSYYDLFVENGCPGYDSSASLIVFINIAIGPCILPTIAGDGGGIDGSAAPSGGVVGGGGLQSDMENVSCQPMLLRMCAIHRRSGPCR